MEVALLLLDGVLDSALAVTRDVLSAANRIAVALGRGDDPFRITMIAPRRNVRTGTGLAVRADRAFDGAMRRRTPEVLIVLGMNVPTPPELDAMLASDDARRAFEVIRRFSARGARVLASCSGSFLCGAAGILEGERAVTSWWLAPHFRARFPGVTLDDARMVVEGARVVTAGAALSQIDLMLWLVRTVRGPEVAELCARYLVVDERASQASISSGTTCST
jgi:transcriptional regulator GlxA family with amidase domain